MIIEITLFLLWFLFCLTPGYFFYNLTSKNRSSPLIYRFSLYFIFSMILTTFSTFILCFFNISSALSIFTSIITLNLFMFFVKLIKNRTQNTGSYRNFIERLKNIEIKENIKNFFKNKIKSYTLLFTCLILGIYAWFFSIYPYAHIDTWVYYNKTIDVLNYQIDLLKYFSRYVDNIADSKLIIYYWITLLSPFKGNLLFHNFILSKIFPLIQLSVFLFLIIFISLKILKINPLYSLGVFIAGYHLNTWISFSLPSSISLILLLLMVINFFSKDFKNLWLGLIFYISIFIYHRPSFILISITFLIIVSKPLFSLLKKNFDQFSTRISNELRIKVSKTRIILVLISFISLIMILLISSPLWSNFLNNIIHRLNLQYEEVINGQSLVIPALDIWFYQLSGPIFIFLSIYGIKYLKKPDKISRNIFLFIKFFYILLFQFVGICIILPIWPRITALPYDFFRYFIFIDLALIFIAPWVFQKLISELSKQKINRKKSIKIKNTVRILFWVQILLFSSLHVQNRYFLDFCHSFTKNDFVDAYFWMRESTDADSLVMVEPFPTSNSRNIFSQSILFDRYIVSYKESKYYFNVEEDLGSPPTTLEEYMISLKNYLVNGTKTLHFAGRALAENLTNSNAPVRYLVMDSLYLTDVYNYMIQDPFFNPIRNFSVVDYEAVSTLVFHNIYYNLTIFEIIVN